MNPKSEDMKNPLSPLVQLSEYGHLLAEPFRILANESLTSPTKTGSASKKINCNLSRSRTLLFIGLKNFPGAISCLLLGSLYATPMVVTADAVLQQSYTPNVINFGNVMINSSAYGGRCKNNNGKIIGTKFKIIKVNKGKIPKQFPFEYDFTDLSKGATGMSIIGQLPRRLVFTDKGILLSIQFNFLPEYIGLHEATFKITLSDKGYLVAKDAAPKLISGLSKKQREEIVAQAKERYKDTPEIVERTVTLTLRGRGFCPTVDDDGDGVHNGTETDNGTDPNNPDSDRDTVDDRTEGINGTNPNNRDSDGDKVNDGIDKFPLDKTRFALLPGAIPSIGKNAPGGGEVALASLSPTTIGSSPLSVGDVNQDGYTDLAIANGNTITVLLGDPDGSMHPGQQLSVIGDVQAVRIDDVNEDNQPDIATLKQDNSPGVVFLNNGDGEFSGQQDYNPKQSQLQANIDVNEDGITDRITLNEIPDHVSVYLGNDDGTYTLQQDLPAGVEPDAVTVADINGDNKPEIIVRNKGSEDVSIFDNLGNSSFEPEQVYFLNVNE